MRIRTVLIVVAIFSVLVSFAQSQPLSPSPITSTKSLEPIFNQSNQTTTQSQNGTEQQPLIVKILPDAKSKAEVEYEIYERQKKSTNEGRLTWATIWLAIVTTFLAVFTAYLWDATRKLVRSAEETAKRQLRAFIFGKGFNYAPHIRDKTIREYVFWVTWENVGLTPGLEVCNWIEVKTLPANEEQQIVFAPSNERMPTVMGPRATVQTGFITVPLKTMMQRWSGEINIFVWSRVEYRDIFDANTIHHHEQCASVELIHDPSDVPPEGHPPYVTFVIRGAQNSTA
jgi:hypothetical protein